METALPDYEVGRELGRGAFGFVFEGRHRNLDRAVAIKQLPRALAADPTMRERFLAEARTVAALQHPHVVPVYDFVERDGLCLLVMEHLGGGSLADRAGGAPLDTATACAVTAQIAAALQYAHEHGVLHRDVKPENILFTTTGVAKLADFGIAKLVEQDSGLTTTGMVVGTPAYLAPEVAMGEPATPAADVYALGAVLYELLAGRRPYPARPTAAAALLQRVNEDPTPLAETAPHVPDALVTVVTRAMARDPGARFASAGALAGALRPFAEGAVAIAEAGEVPSTDRPSDDDEAGRTQAPMGVVRPEGLPRRGRRWGVVVAAGVAVLALVIGAVALVGGGDDEPADATPETASTTSLASTSGPTTSAPSTTDASGATGGSGSPGFTVLTDATTKFRGICADKSYTEAQCTCAIDRIQREVGLAAFVDVTTDLVRTGRTNRPNAVAIMAQCFTL